MNSGNGSDLFLETLIDEGVRCMFGNPGTTELPLMDALVNESRLDYILCLQESVTIGAAEGYAYATGGVGVVNLHVAPGLGNAMGMLYNIKRAGTPLIVTAGNQGQRGQLSEPVLWDDLPRIAEPLTKWSYEVRRVEDLEQSVRRAIKYALTPPTGPVFLSLPGDVMLAETGGPTGRPRGFRAPFPRQRNPSNARRRCSPKPRIHTSSPARASPARARWAKSPGWRSASGRKCFPTTARTLFRSPSPIPCMRENS